MKCEEGRHRSECVFTHSDQSIPSSDAKAVFINLKGKNEYRPVFASVQTDLKQFCMIYNDRHYLCYMIQM